MNPILTYRSAPSALNFMVKAFLPTSGWQAERGFPDLRLAWSGFRIDADATQNIRKITCDDTPLSPEKLALLAPGILGFRLLMVMVTHRRWPLPIWNALQTRNRFILHRPIAAGDSFDLNISVAGWRVLEKGLEVDLHTRLVQGDDCAWESIVTFYYRGRFGAPLQHGTALGAAADAPSVSEQGDRQTWRVNGDNRWQFGALTGDYNGIHQWDAYARRLGFRKAFAHPQRIAAQCLAHLPMPNTLPLHLDLWLRGPVFYNSEITLITERPADGNGINFAVKLSGDERPAMIGSQRYSMT
jgi:acyl dehydratase